MNGCYQMEAGGWNSFTLKRGQKNRVVCGLRSMRLTRVVVCRSGEAAAADAELPVPRRVGVRAARVPRGGRARLLPVLRHAGRHERALPGDPRLLQLHHSLKKIYFFSIRYSQPFSSLHPCNADLY